MFLNFFHAVSQTVDNGKLSIFAIKIDLITLKSLETIT